MSALPGILALVIFLYLRPQDFFDALRDWNLIYILLGMCLLGLLRDVLRRRIRPAPAPQLGWALLFMLWCLLTLAVRRPSELLARAPTIVICVLIYAILAHGIPRIDALLRVFLLVFAIGLFVAYVGVDQGLSPLQCVVINPGDTLNALPDGRPCATDEDQDDSSARQRACIETGVPGVMYRCERAGLLGTTSIGGGRVRYLGMLEDPNDLALATAMAVPTAFALFQLRRSLPRLALLAATLALIGAEIVLTGSRGGQLTFAAVLGAYFVKAYGLRRGLLVGAVLAIPIVFLGGRSDSDADDSTLERLGCACAGLKMLMHNPLLGVGFSRFTENHHLTAHNAYILAAGELGIPGMALFAFVLYLSLKIPVEVLRLDLGDRADGRTIKALAMGLLASLGGGAVGIYFLSWTYHGVLWIQFGLSGALYSVVKVDHPRFSCRLSWREGCLILAGYLGVLTLWAGYVRFRGAWE